MTDLGTERSSTDSDSDLGATPPPIDEISDLIVENGADAVGAAPETSDLIVKNGAAKNGAAAVIDAAPEKNGRNGHGAPAATAGGHGGIDDTPDTGRRLGHIPYKWVALGVVLLGTIMTILDSTIVNIAINALQADFHVGTSDVAWVVTGYLLAQGAVIPMSGWATDRWGTKRLYLGTIFLFTAASAACGLAGSVGQLIVFRVLQGLGGGMLMPIGMTIILRAVGPRQMGKVMGIFGIPMLLAPAAGPILGGWFVQDFSWRLIFYVNVPIGILAFFLAYRLLVDTPKQGKLKLDYAGLLTATPAVLALMYAVDRSTTLGWSSALVTSLLVVAVVFFTAFVATQLKRRALGGSIVLAGAVFALVDGVVRAAQVGLGSADALIMLAAAALGFVGYWTARGENDDPLLHLELFRDITFRASMVLSLFIVTSMFGGMLLLPLFLQQVHGLDPIHTALLLLPQAATAAIAMPLGGILSDRIGPRNVVIFGLLLLGASSLLLTNLHPETTDTFIILALALRGFAMGFAMMPSMSAALARIPRHLTSRASSITNTMQRVGSSIGIAVLVTFLSAQVTAAASEAPCNPSQAAIVQAEHLPGHPATAQAVCASLASSIQTAVTTGQAAPTTPAQQASALGQLARTYANNTMSIAFDRAFALTAVLSFLGIIPALFLRKPDVISTDEAVPMEMAG